MDDLTPDQRRRAMQANRSRDTQPELMLRRALRVAGLTGYRLHRRQIPGSPDVAFTRWWVAVFVDGDFWHGGSKWKPESASEFWVAKINRNIERDRLVDAELEAAGWAVVRLWESDVRRHAPRCVGAVVAALELRGFVADEGG